MINVGIVGGTGYTGVELLRLLVAHPDVCLKVITSRSEAGNPVTALFPNLRGSIDLAFEIPDIDTLSNCDVVFFATPNGTAMKMTRELVNNHVRVIDLAADFRIKDIMIWQDWYNMEHACPDLVKEAVYGLPEFYREDIRSARIVANPGCYPTAVQLGLMPLVEKQYIDLSSIIADAKSGVSGAGRKASVGALFSEAHDSFKAYAVSGHRHLPEIKQGLQQMSGAEVGLTFVPHLTPMIRGIHATIYARLNKNDLDVQALYESRYHDDLFIDVLPEGAQPETRSVRGSNFCRLAIYRPQNESMLVILSVIDNLVKGAAGQAIQNMNIMMNIDEDAGLRAVALLP